MPVFHATPPTLLAQLRTGDNMRLRELAWHQFIDIYKTPLAAVAGTYYRRHTGTEPGSAFIDDVVAAVIRDFYEKSRHRYDPAKGRLRDFLRVLVNARVVDLLRREKPARFNALDSAAGDELPAESDDEKHAWQHAKLAFLLEELRRHIPLKQFEIFHRIKIEEQSTELVAGELNMTRNAVDLVIHRVTKKLQKLAETPEYKAEFD